MSRYAVRTLVAACSLVLVSASTVWAQADTEHTVVLNPGDTLTAECSTTLTGTYASQRASISCFGATPLPTTPPTSPTPVPPGEHHLGRCGESMALWHPPVVGDCETQHEHGDAPPAWVTASAWPAMFDHPGNTPNENILKHTSFKGFEARLDGIDLYVVMHLDTNPSGHNSRFHSYQMWARDGAGEVSHWDGWTDFADDDAQAGPTIRRHGCDDTGERPIMAVNDEACGVVRFENWYPRPGGHNGNGLWMPDFGFNVSPNYYTGGDPADPTTWVPTGGENATRRIEIAWYAGRSDHRGTFWATNFGEVVSGPSAPECGTTRTIGGRTYPVLCIQQHVSETLTSVQFPDNAVQKTYDMTGVVNPN